MANLKSDLEGFLTGGEPLVSMRRSGDTAMIGNHLSSIDRNIAALTSAVLGGARMRGTARGTATVTAKLRGEAVASSSASRLPAPGGMIAVPGGMRDASGRFIKNGSSRPAGGGGGDGGGGAGGSNASMRNLAAKLTDAIKGGAEGVGDADPAVRAMQEVAGPLSRGLNFLRGDEDTRRQEGWFKRILKRLQGIEEGQGKPVTVDESSGGAFGVLSRAVPALVPVIGGLAAAIAPLLALLGISNAAGDTSKDQARIDALKDGVAEPLKESLKEMGLDSDGRIAKNREAALAGRDGEYAKEAALRSQFVSPTNAMPGTRRWNDEFYAYSQGELAKQDAEAKKGFVERSMGKLGAKWDAVKGTLAGAAVRAGVDPGLLAKIANFESGFDPNAAPIAKDPSKNKVRLFDGRMGISSAHGLGQFTDATWLDTLRKHGAKYGVEGASTLTPAAAAALRGNTDLQASMLAELTAENVAKGRKFGGTDDAASVYALHNLGGGDGRKLLTALRDNPGMSVRDALLQGAKTDKERARIEQVISGNRSLYGGGSISVEAAYANMGKMMSRGNRFAEAIAVGPSPIGPMGGFKTPQFPAIPDAPQLRIPLGSNDPTPVVVMNNTPDVSRDLSNRRLAHIVTGGVAQ